MIRFVTDFGYMGLGLISSTIALFNMESVERTHHFLGKILFNNNNTISDKTKRHLKHVHVKRIGAWALLYPKKALVFGYSLSFLRKIGAVVSTILIGALVPDKSAIGVIPGNHLLTKIFYRVTAPVASPLWRLTFDSLKRHHIILLSPIILKVITVILEVIALNLEKTSDKTTSLKILENIIKKACKTTDYIGHKIEAIFWVRIALLIIAGNSGFIQHDTNIRGFFSRIFPLAGSVTTAVLSFFQSHISTDIKQLDELCEEVSKVGNLIDDDHENFTKNTELHTLIDKIMNADLEKADRKHLLGKIAKKICNKFHKLMHPHMLRMDIPELKQRFEEKAIRQAFEMGAPLKYANILFTLRAYEVFKQIDHRLTSPKESDKTKLQDLIADDEYLEHARNSIEVVTDPLPQLHDCCTDDFNALSSTAKREHRLVFLQGNQFFQNPDQNPYQTLLQFIHDHYHDTYKPAFERIKDESNNDEKRDLYDTFADAYGALSDLCGLLQGDNFITITGKTPKEHRKEMTKRTGLAVSFSSRTNKAEELRDKLTDEDR